MFCHKCGNDLSSEAVFCTKCGAQLIVDETTEPMVQASEEPDTAEQEHQPAPSNDTSMSTNTSGGSRSVVSLWGSIGSKAVPLVAIYATISAILGISINPVIVVIGLILGAIGVAIRVIDKLYKNSKILTFGIIGVAAIVVIVIAVTLFGGNGGGISGNDRYVQMVKDGTLDGYPQKTVGKAFDDFLSSSMWESGLSEDNERFVNVSGGILYFEKEVDLVVQFMIDESNQTFMYNASEINGVPQNDLFFWGLLETIYNDDATLTASASHSDSTPMSGDNRIVIGETKSYDNYYGNMEVTLDYVEFTDRIENTLLGGYLFPDEGSVFLRSAFTVKNIGTQKGSLITAWSTVVYDDMYEFRYSFTEGTLTDINPLTPPATGEIIFEVPIHVAESDESLVISINDESGTAVISFVIRPVGLLDAVIQDKQNNGDNVTSAVSDTITEEMAIQLIGEWLNEHPLVDDAQPELDNQGIDTFSGRDYYQFLVFHTGAPIQALFLVDQENGELFLFNYMQDDPMPLNQWYWDTWIE